MATTVARLQALLSADTGQFDKSMKQSESRMSKVGKVAGVAGTAIAGGLIVGLKKSVSAAMDSQKVQAGLESQMRALNIGYGTHKAQIDKVINSTSKLAAVDDEELTQSFTRLLPATGNVKEALKQTALAADIARARNVSLESATKLVTRANTGSTGALRKLGISMQMTTKHTDAVKKAQDAYKASHKELTPAIKEQFEVEKKYAKAQDVRAQGVQNIAKLQDTFKGAAKDYGKTSAAAQERIQVSVENLEESMGTLLLPAITKVANWAAKLADYLTDNQKVAKILVATLGALSGVLLAVWAGTKLVSAATKIYTAITKIATAAQWLWNAAMEANPIGIIIIALVALGVAFMILWKKSETFRNIVNGVWTAVKNAALAFRDAILGVVDKIKDKFSAIMDWLKGHWKDALIILLGGLPGLMWIAIREAWEKFSGPLKEKFTDFVTWVHENITMKIIGFFGGLPKGMADALVSGVKKFGSLIHDAVVGIFDKLPGAIKKLLGIDSPSKVFADIGANIVKGAISGIQKMGPALRDKAMGLFSSVAGAVGGFVGGLVPGGGAIDLGSGSQLAQLLNFAHGEGFSPSINQTTGGTHVKGSLHYQGKAVDLSGSASQMRQAFLDAIRYFGSKINELFYDPMGWYIDNGRAVQGAIGGHSDHVHLGLFDRGGYLQPGWNLAYNGLGRPEPVGMGNVYITVQGSVVRERELWDIVRREGSRFKKLNGTTGL